MINTLPEFESRQVLTSDELNWLTCYLDAQNRESRRFLIGCGLLGGLQVQLVNNTIQISSGCGLTSAGHIVRLQHASADVTVYTKTRKYVQKPKEKYAFHYLSDTDVAQEDYSASTQGSDIYFPGFQHEILELCEDTMNDAAPIIAGTVQDKIVVLFAEIIQKELKDCEDDNCQERGKKYLFNTRPLLISKQDALFLLGKEYGQPVVDETVFSQLAYPWLFLPNINLLKPAFSATSVNDTFNESTLQAEYQRCIQDFVTTLNKVQLDESLRRIKNYSANANTGYNIADQLITIVQDSTVLTAGNKPIRLCQVIYDFLWSFVKAYQELQLECQSLRARTKVDAGAFPNHVLLGVVSASNPDFENSTSRNESIFRHPFRSSFAQSEQARISRSVSLMLDRLRLLVSEFDPSRLTGSHQVRITPGGHVYDRLSTQAIPWYFKSSITTAWSHTMSVQQNLRTYVTHYAITNENQPPSVSLQYNTYPLGIQGDHAFYRIEGAHGQPALNALNDVFQLRKKHALPFEVLMLRLNEKSPFSHAFNYTVNEDVESMYQVIRAELIKQITLNTSFLWSLSLKPGKFEPTKTALIKALEQSYMLFLGNLNTKLLATPIAMVLTDAVLASNIAISKSAKTEVVEPKFMELQATILKEKQPSTTFIKKTYAPAAGIDMDVVKAKNFLPEIFDFEIGILFFNNLGNLVNSIKTNEKFSKTTDISFYTHMLTVCKSMRKNAKLDDLFLMSLQLYCSLKLQEEYLSENFLDLNILPYRENLEGNLIPACSAIHTHLRKLTGEFVVDDDILDNVDRKEMLSYTDRIRFDDDWIKIIQVDTENKKRNGGLGVENLLGRFVKIHPGLSHGSGVPKGGTYIMVYDQANQVMADFFLPYIISSHLRPIQYTLLESKTLTLSGTVKEESGAPVKTSLFIGTATIPTDKEGFYNALVSENTTVKIICKPDGFQPFEQDVEIKDKPVTLDIILKRSDVKKTTIVRFSNQLNEAINDDIRLLNVAKNAEEVAPAGVLSITDLPQSSHKYTVKDARFAEKDFAIVIGTADKEEKVVITQIDVVRVRITDMINERYDPTLLKDIRLTDANIEFDTSDIIKGIFVTKEKVDISKPVTVEVRYNDMVKKQSVLAGEKENEVRFEDEAPVEPRKLNSFLRLVYSPSDSGAPTAKVAVIKINDLEIPISDNTDLGEAEIATDGTILLDKRFRNAPEVKIENIKKVRNAIFVMDGKLIADRVDITAKRCILTFNKALTAVQIKELLIARKEFKLIAEKTDLNMLNFFCILMSPADIKQINTILKD